MPYEVCYRALLSISVVEGLKPHTRDLHATLRRAPARRGLYTTPYRGPPAFAGLDHNVRFHPEDSLAGGPPARWFVIIWADDDHDTLAKSLSKRNDVQHVYSG